MAGMPYHLEKGPIFSVLESFVNQTPKRTVLERLRDQNTRLVDVGGVNSTTLNAPPYPTFQARCDHINEDWFGFAHGGNSQPPRTAGHPTTGLWKNYYGDVEGIVRLTLCRAVEAAMGIDHNQALTDDLTIARDWPIELFWKCPNPWFEGWVSWRCDPSNSGQGRVTVIFATPGNGAVVLSDPRNGRNPVVEPTSADPDQGMWIVTHAGHDRVVTPTHLPTPLQQVPLPNLALGVTWVGKEGLTTVAPSFIDGGAQSGGLPYAP
jgi:hypothetical protein